MGILRVANQVFISPLVLPLKLFQSHRVRSGDFKGRYHELQRPDHDEPEFQSHRVRSGDFKKEIKDEKRHLVGVSISSSEKWGF